MRATQEAATGALFSTQRSIGKGTRRAADFWRLPDGAPLELIAGHFVPWPPRDLLHQTVVGLLSTRLLGASRVSGGAVAMGPIDVSLADDTIVQPDVAYAAKERRHIIDEYFRAAPDLIIEVESPDHAARDRVHKLALYAEHGVPEYWIVDPAERVIEFLLLDGDRYKVEPLTSDAYQSPRLAEVAIDLPSFWADVAKLVSG